MAGHFHRTCYQNIRQLGLEYDATDYGEAMPFLLMLPGGIAMNEQDA